MKKEGTQMVEVKVEMPNQELIKKGNLTTDSARSDWTILQAE